MSQVKRNFRKNDVVYVVDYWGTLNGSAAFSVRAIVIDVDEEKKNFDAVLYGDTCQRYGFEDYGRLVFDTAKEADDAANKLPTPGTMVYLRKAGRVYKRKVDSIGGGYVDDKYDLNIRFERGENISIKELGVTIFIDEPTAKYK